MTSESKQAKAERLLYWYTFNSPAAKTELCRLRFLRKVFGCDPGEETLGA